MKISLFYNGKLGLIPKTDDVAKWTCGIKVPWSFLPLLSTRVPQKMPRFESISNSSIPFSLRLTNQRNCPRLNTTGHPGPFQIRLELRPSSNLAHTVSPYKEYKECWPCQILCLQETQRRRKHHPVLKKTRVTALETPLLIYL